MLNIESELLSSTSLGKVNDVERLLIQGADVNCQDERGRSPLMIATQKNNFEMAELLINHGADVNLRDKMLLTPWICAAANGFYEILKVGANKADVNLVNRFGGTALLPSSEKGFLMAAIVSLQSGVPVNHINDLGWSALQEAVVLGDGKSLYSMIIRVLIENGAEINKKDHYHKTVLDWANEHNQKYVLDILTNNINKESSKEILIDTIIEEISNQHFKSAEVKADKGIEKYNEPLFYFLKGYSLLLQKSYFDAIDVYSNGLEKSEGDPEFYFYIANVYRELKDSKQAIENFQKGIDHNPDNFFFRYHLTNYLRELGKHEEAIKHTNILIENNPERYDYLFHKANSLRVLGKEREADKLLKEFSQKEG